MENMENLAGGGTVKYIKPQMEIVELSGDNVIVTSCTSMDGVPWWGGEGG
ncbi:MAG: hypothetical protein IJ664_04905 [Clostridia bacterium]|nr:hypothetical protein [Clostridia bacterium]